MEKFVIEDGKLIKYENDRHSLDEVRVPEGVKFIQAKAFYGYRIKHLILPDSLGAVNMFAFDSISCNNSKRGTVARSITYRGVSFDPDFNTDSIIPWTAVQMIAGKDYSYQVALYDVKKKYEIIVKIYMCDKDEMTQQYIKKRFRTIFMYFLKNYEMYNGFTPKYSELYFSLLEYLIKSEEFISKRNIETYIQAAKEKNVPEILDMLMDYKYNTLKLTD